MSRFRLIISVVAAAALVAVIAVPVLGTPGSGVISAGVLARGDFMAETDVKFKFTTDRGTEVASAQGAGDVIMQRIELGPNGRTGWHTHPGPAVAVVQSGSLTILSAHDGACEMVMYEAGDSFVDQGQGHVHDGRNPSGTANAIIYVTYFDVDPASAGPRIDAADPGSC